MSNQLRDIKVDHVSFVAKAATRDPRDPTQPRRFLLFKSESGAPSNDKAVPWKRETPVIQKSEGERTDDMATATDTQAQTADEREAELSEMLVGLESDRDRLRKQPPHERPAGLLERIEAAHAKLARAHGEIMRPGSASRAESVKKSDVTGGLADAQRMAEQIRKSDPSMSESQAFVAAMQDPRIAKAYADEMGIRVQIAKAPDPAGSPADVALKAQAIAKSEGLSGSAAYAKALRDLTPEQYARGMAA